MMRRKLGFIDELQEDESFIKKLLFWMEENRADYTNTFLYLMDYDLISDSNYQKNSFKEIHINWKKRIDKNNKSRHIVNDLMKSNNPFIIPRNHMVEKALDEACQNNDFNYFNRLLELLKNPYEEKKIIDEYTKPSSDEFLNNYRTFCGT